MGIRRHGVQGDEPGTITEIAESSAASCLFCDIVAGVVPAHRIFEDAHTVAFLDLSPATRGHTLVIPRVHALDLLDASPEQAPAVIASSPSL